MIKANRRIVILKAVRSDLPWMRDLIAEAGVYDAWVNPQGAVAVEVNGELLGIKPKEFEWMLEH